MTAVRILPDPAALADAAARLVVEQARAAIDARGRFSLALSGGSTPRALHLRLTQPPLSEQVDWQRVHIFFGDERCVLPDDDRSNYHMARETLLSKVAIPTENVHRMAGELPPEAAASHYQAQLEAFFGTERPRLDTVLLGMGDNGHTASLFPGLTAVHEQRRWVVAEYVVEVGMWRITLTPAVLNLARLSIFLVSGQPKADMLHRVLEERFDPSALPAQVIRPLDGDVVWLVDSAAAERLSPPPG